jgi:hypothetical protein
LLRYKAFLSVGHDEYWSKPMYDAVRRARDAGVNLAFFGGNEVFWQVRLEPSAGGKANRVIVCYKDATKDPRKGPLTTVGWSDRLVGRPTQTLVGLTPTSLLHANVPYVVSNSSNWVYTGTGLKDYWIVRGMVGYETDRYDPAYPLPPHTSYTLLSHSPLIDVYGKHSYANSSIYRSPSGAWVFAAGTIGWDLGLVDPRIQRVTANVLAAFISSPGALRVNRVGALRLPHLAPLGETVLRSHPLRKSPY